MGLLAHEHRAGRGVGLEPSGGVHRVTERGVLDPVPGSYRAHHDRARFDADAHAEALDAPAAVDLTSEFLDLAHDSEPGPDRSLGIVLMRKGCAKECEDPVAGGGAWPDLASDPRLWRVGSLTCGDSGSGGSFLQVREFQEHPAGWPAAA